MEGPAGEVEMEEEAPSTEERAAVEEAAKTPVASQRGRGAGVAVAIPCAIHMCPQNFPGHPKVSRNFRESWV